MFTYQQNKSTECLPCVAETFKALTQDPETARKIDDVRRLNACGNVAEAKKRKDSLPGCLYQTREVLESIGEAKYNQGKKGRWRLQSQCVLNGLVMCDFDHVEGDPRQIFDSWGLKETTTQTTGTTQTTEAASGVDKSKILLAFITPSGEGLKVVFIADINYNLTDNQKMMAKQLGLTAKIDKGTKDSSRLSYIPKWDDIAAELTEDLSAINLDENEDGVYCYHGVPYTDILKKWLELTGGTPDIGDRHDRMLGLSGELRRIMNNKPANVLWLMKQADFYEEFVKEGREKELERMAVDVCKFRPRGAMSEELAQALDSFGIKYTKLEVQNNLPYDDWADRLLALPLGCYEAALAHVDNPRVKPGAVITASGMYSVLLTRCDYQNWKGDMQRLNSLVLMCGEPASGKAVAKEQDEHIMLTMRESDKPARQAEKAYKKEKNARNTSSKAQKGEALQEPGGIIRYNVVKVSNNRFYKHAENNKETGYDGQQWFLHQYMFSTELLSLINAKGGFQEKRDIMLQAFHNERNGVDYANSDSVNDSMPMMFSGVFTCTRTSLQQFINARNIGDGLSTRMTPWVMPEEDYHTDEYRASRRDKTPAHMMEEWGARFDALKCEIKGLEKLVRHVYDLCAALGEEARINEDKVLNLERKRLQDKVMAVCIPQVISTQPSWEEFVKTGVCQIEQHHLDFADLMCEIINKCEDALFGQLLQDMYDNEARDTQLRRVYDKTAKFYSMLPDEFTTQDVQRVWGYSKIVNASQRVSKFVKENVIEMIDRGKYRKLAKAVG